MLTGEQYDIAKEFCERYPNDWTISSDRTPHLRYIGKETDGRKIVMPPEGVHDYTATFKNSNLIIPPVIPEGVTSLFDAFRGCKQLKYTCNFPSTLTNLGHAFVDCARLESSDAIPDGVSNCEDAFKGCISLKSVANMGNAPRSKRMFYGCTSLEAMPPMGNDVEDLTSTFEGCEKLKSVADISAKAKHFVRTFAGCKSLETGPAQPAGTKDITAEYADCANLKALPEGFVKLDLDGVTYMEPPFEGCDKLIDAGIVDEYGVPEEMSGISGHGGASSGDKPEYPF